MPSYIGVGWLWAESAVDSRGVAKVVMRENGTYLKLANVVQLWCALESDTLERQPLTQVATWCIGECGDLLLYGPPASEDSET